MRNYIPINRSDIEQLLRDMQFSSYRYNLNEYNFFEHYLEIAYSLGFKLGQEQRSEKDYDEGYSDGKGNGYGDGYDDKEAEMNKWFNETYNKIDLWIKDMRDFDMVSSFQESLDNLQNIIGRLHGW